MPKHGIPLFIYINPYNNKLLDFRLIYKRHKINLGFNFLEKIIYNFSITCSISSNDFPFVSGTIFHTNIAERILITP